MVQKSILSFLLVLMSYGSVHSQILISLIFGDKLNSEKLEFGLDGGLAITDIKNLAGSEFRTGLNLGLYFDIQLKENSNFFVHTGVILKSPAGAKGLESYPIGNADLDLLLSDSEIQRKLHYFYVPGLFRYRHSSFFFIEAGPQIGLLRKAEDRFMETVNGENSLVYSHNIKDDYNTIDFGGTLGVGYKLLKGEGISIGARYYLGFTDILKSGQSSQYNRIGYLFVSIPIGANKEE